jgi:predicted site-specific integrase-resolvase
VINMKKYTINQTAAKLGVSTETVRRGIRSCKVVAIKNGKQWEISEEEIIRLTSGRGEKIVTILDRLNRDGSFSASQTAKVIDIISGII